PLPSPLPLTPRSTLVPYTTLFRSHGNHGGDGGSDHAADQRKSILQVHAEQGRLCDSKIAGNTGGHIDLLGSLILLLQQGHDQYRSEEHTSELQSRFDLVCRLLLEK